MSRTLFRYIFWDMLKIFGLASGVLSGIMSFGGLLRPLYEFGLDISQVGAILGWSGPAMTAYSLPIAALFATTIVYGRFSADNETTACRAAGISYLAMTMPAFVLGILTAIVSLGLLCFAVPYSMLKVEKIIYSNIAQLVAEQIDRTHQVKFDFGSQSYAIFAQSAQVLPVDRSRPADQRIRLLGPMIVRYEPGDPKKPRVPREFFMATSATATIQQSEQNESFLLSADLDRGVKIPRSFEGGNEHKMQVSVETAHFGPKPLESPVRENTKFMDILRLNQVILHPEESRNVRKLLDDLVIRDQQNQYLMQLAEKLNSPTKTAELVGAAGEVYALRNSSALAEVGEDRLAMTAAGPGDSVWFVQTKGTQTPFSYEAKEIRVEAFPNSSSRRMELTVETLESTMTQAGQEADHHSSSRPISVQMPDDIYRLQSRPASAYVETSNPGDVLKLRRGLWRLYNSAKSEIHARLSFSVSCFILVMVGCALGMMFRSGNFLSAFALSVAPALLSIALIVTGQHTCENVGDVGNLNWTNPLNLGIALIWSGNAAVLVIGAVLLGRLQKQ